MSLEEEIGKARKDIISDGYEMSIGEVMNLYRDKEIVIDPEFQRLFRWTQTQKTRFIESLLLGIPIPPIFVVQDEKGVWELIDGLQRLSTVLEFGGLLRVDENQLAPPSVLEGTTFLPTLAGKRWEPSGDGQEDGIGKSQQLQIKRARLRVEILKKESDPLAKYELFQRLNTGGAQLTPQEVRNCVGVMINRDFQTWLVARSNSEDFKETTAQTLNALEQQAGVELALRFFAFRRVPYQAGLDVHEYLDQALVTMARDADFPHQAEQDVFDQTFGWLRAALGTDAFKKWNAANQTFGGMFLMSLFEVTAIGVSRNVAGLGAMNAEARSDFIRSKVKELWDNPVFTANSGAGVRGTSRLANLLPMGEAFFHP